MLFYICFCYGNSGLKQNLGYLTAMLDRLFDFMRSPGWYMQNTEGLSFQGYVKKYRRNK